MPDFLRNRVTERDIRGWLEQNGYQGKAAILDHVELYAIERPGWKQLFRFQAKVRLRSTDDQHEEERTQVWGVVMDDERQPKDLRTQVTLFETEEAQQEQLSILSVDMLTAKRDQGFAGAWSLLLLGLLFAAILLVVAITKKYLL